MVTFPINGGKAFYETKETVMFNEVYITKADLKSFNILHLKDRIIKWFISIVIFSLTITLTNLPNFIMQIRLVILLSFV